MQHKDDTSPRLVQDIYDLTGQTFGETDVIGLHHIIRGRRFWLCRRRTCGTETIRPAHEFRGKDAYCATCSRNAIIAIGPPTPQWMLALGFDETFAYRFWQKVVKTEICWLWDGVKNSSGYGCIATGMRQNGHAKLIVTNRSVWMLVNGQIPTGMEVCHDCANKGAAKDCPWCVRPDHLFLDTHKGNFDDAKDKQYRREGQHWTTKINAVDVVKIHELMSAGASRDEIAAVYGLHPRYVSEIRSGRRWPHLKPI